MPGVRPEQLDAIARRTHERMVLEGLLQHRSVADATLVWLAPASSPTCRTSSSRTRRASSRRREIVESLFENPRPLDGHPAPRRRVPRGVLPQEGARARTSRCPRRRTPRSRPTPAPRAGRGRSPGGGAAAAAELRRRKHRRTSSSGSRSLTVVAADPRRLPREPGGAPLPRPRPEPARLDGRPEVAQDERGRRRDDREHEERLGGRPPGHRPAAGVDEEVLPHVGDREEPALADRRDAFARHPAAQRTRRRSRRTGTFPRRSASRQAHRPAPPALAPGALTGGARGRLTFLPAAV